VDHLSRADLGNVAFTAVLLLCNQTQGLARGSQVGHDDPWDVERIDRLPDEIRTAVIRMCRNSPQAGHYFATYIYNSRVMKLHFEHLHCGGQTPFCKDHSSHGRSDQGVRERPEDAHD
jgi:hypothetical protein